MVYFDGSCPLCRAEIEAYRRGDRAGSLCFVDVSERGAALPEGVSRRQVMERFHVRASDGRLLSGAAAFVEVWSRLPEWRWAARVASVRGVTATLEAGYRMFLPVRPFISRLFGRIQALRSIGDRGRHP
jgi:predicted DCC family thiol-disulfide oxidoreductase YuxK